VLPYIGSLLYALLRQPSPASGTARSAEETGTSTMARVRELIDAHAASAIEDEEFAAAKREVFGL
jgi:hypothetical protein